MDNKPDKCPKCGESVVMVEYWYDNPYRYDGVSELACSKGCGWRVGRWCGKELVDNEVEPRYCEGDKHPKL